MICLSFKEELAKINITVDNSDCLRQMGILYKKCIGVQADIAPIILGLFYQKEASLYAEENAIKELNAIIADLNENYPSIYFVELKLILAKNLIDLGDKVEAQKILKSLINIKKESIMNTQYKYIRDNYIEEKKLVLKGKELILFSNLEVAPCEKFDLIFTIYGDDCDISKAERSFKTLLNRLRKKIDQEIILNTDNLYELR